MKADQQLARFSEFLSNCWLTVSETLSADQERLDDWKQANWEILVESLLVPASNTFLEVYGSGADCNGSSSRVWRPEALPTHRIRCQGSTQRTIDVLTGKNVVVQDLTFDRLVAWKGEKYVEAPPFDHVLLESDDEIFVVRLSELEFEIVPLQ